ncbi:MAG: energy-coupling factor transporter ATPase [Halobacteriota archaeon]|nr:energy-coupling factor transporter ATPase [Halobacteriota archaeon]
MIEIDNLTFFYADSEKPALEEINLDVKDGEFLLITGPSGSGKSSLCRCLNGLIPHFYGGKIRGRIIVQGANVLQAETNEIARTVGMVYQDPENQLVMSSVEREIAFGLENLGFPEELILKRIEESFDAAGICSLRKRHPTELSGGEKQKVAIASVLALHPKILILDEPTSQLDPKGTEEVLSLVQRLNDELGLTVILVEHRMERVIHWVDRLIIMNGGRICIDGDPGEVLTDGIPPIGIGLPPIIELARGLKIDKTPLSVKEGRIILKELFKDADASKFVLKDEKIYGNEIVKVKDLSHAYGDIPALAGVNLSISEGEFVAIMGRNGSGKTTLAKHFNGLLKPAKGDVTICGVNTKKATVAELARTVGYLFQNPNNHLFADTVKDEILFTLKTLGIDEKKRADEVIERFDLTRYMNEYPRFLSGGEKERVALASIIVSQPKILILDEPTRGMEQGLKRMLCKFMDEYRSDGNAVVLITHDVELVAKYADRVLLLSDGGIVVDGPTREVLSSALLFSPQINRLMQAFDLPFILTVEEALGVL